MKTKWIALMILAAGTAFSQTRFSVGIGIGTPGYYAPAPVPYVAAQPPMPGPGYVWINGYYNPYRQFVSGYWALPPFAGAYWVAPRYYGGRYVAGYWGGRGYYGNRYYSAPRYDRGVRFRGHSYGNRGRGYGRGFRR
jgi:hypothetical protein